MDIQTYERIQPHAEMAGIKFFIPNSHVLWRVQTLLTKEPCTIEWIDGMPAGALFYDVGANIGQYTLYAAKKGLHVHAFEPESCNFALLNRNIALNNFKNVTAWPMAIDIGPKIAPLHLSAMIPGGSCHAFDKNLDFRGEEKEFSFDQGSISVAMDTFAVQYGFPDYIKIDVDGFEHRVCGGAHRCLQHAKSVLIEINTAYPQHMALVDNLRDEYGFKTDEAQILAARRTEGTFAGIGNIIFFKGDSWK